MQIVINIDDEDYERLKEYEKAPFNSLTSRVYEAIANGTLLQKGHGRLIDADAVLVEPFGNTYKDIDIAETIIEADRAERSDKE